MNIISPLYAPSSALKAVLKLLTVAACGMNDVTKARVALKRLPLLKRGKAKKACKKLGVSL